MLTEATSCLHPGQSIEALAQIIWPDPVWRPRITEVRTNQ
jgi:hypothetical protein